MVHVSWSREIDSHVAHKEKENSPNEQYSESNPLVLPETNLPLTSSPCCLCKKLTKTGVGDFAYFQTQTPSVFTSPLTMCVFACLLPVTEACCPGRVLFHSQVFFCCWKYLFYLVLLWSSKQTGKHPKIQNHSKFLFHTGDHFVLCPPAGARLLGGNEMLSL